MSIFGVVHDYFYEDDVVLVWPMIFGVGMVEKWKFSPGPENYDFAPRPIFGYSEF